MVYCPGKVNSRNLSPVTAMTEEESNNCIYHFTIEGDQVHYPKSPFSKSSEIPSKYSGSSPILQLYPWSVTFPLIFFLYLHCFLVQSYNQEINSVHLLSEQRLKISTLTRTEMMSFPYINVRG